MNIVSVHGNEEIAKVYVAALDDEKEKMVEFAESVQPPVARENKWVLIVSSLLGCPVGCKMCDAGGSYKGKLTADEILSQIDHMVLQRYPDRKLPQEKFKIQFARMGEPAMNMSVLDVLETLPEKYDAPGLLPCVSTVAPASSNEFFEKLKPIKDKYFSEGRFQLQFSIHSTDTAKRDEMIPINKWSMEQIARFGHAWREPGDRKVTLNFAAAKGFPIEPNVVKEIFGTEDFLIKITPINPTFNSRESGLETLIDPKDPSSADALVESFKEQGFDVILSIGEVEENDIGSNCGMYLQREEKRVIRF